MMVAHGRCIHGRPRKNQGGVVVLYAPVGRLLESRRGIFNKKRCASKPPSPFPPPRIGPRAFLRDVVCVSVIFNEFHDFLIVS